MSRHEDIDNAIWADPDFEALSADATLLYLWSFTNPRCGMGGIYKVSHRAMTESKVSSERLPAALDELADAGFAFYESNVLWVRTRVKHLRARSPKMARSIANDLVKIPAAHPLRARFLSEYGSWRWLRDELARPSIDGQETISENPVNKGYLHTVSRPSVDGPNTGTGSSCSSSSSSTRKLRRVVDQDEPPVSLPQKLHSVLSDVTAILDAIHVERGGNTPTLRGVGLAIDAHRDRDHLAVARELQHWALAGTGQNKPIVDWARTYATFLRRSPAASPIRTVGSVERKQSPSDILLAMNPQLGEVS